MKFVIIGAVLPPAYYLITYARFTWRDNRTSSYGSILIAIMSILLPALLLLFR